MSAEMIAPYLELAGVGSVVSERPSKVLEVLGAFEPRDEHDAPEPQVQLAMTLPLRRTTVCGVSRTATRSAREGAH